MKRRWFIAVSIGNSIFVKCKGELTATLSLLGTHHPVDHRHYRHDHLCRDYSFPHTIREPGNQNS